VIQGENGKSSNGNNHRARRDERLAREFILHRFSGESNHEKHAGHLYKLG
jgi:hypothetical protein